MDFEWMYSALFATYATFLLYTFAVTAAHYPPCRNNADAPTGASSCAPPGVEGYYPLGLVFLFCIIFIVHLSYKSTNRQNGILPFRGIDISIHQSWSLPFRAIGISISYFAGATIASKEGIFPYSWASGGIVATQAILLGTLFEIANRPDPTNLPFKSDPEVQFHIENWRQFVQILLTASIALGIGVFLQTYSSEYMNSRHLVTILGPLAVALGIALMLVRQRIERIGSYLGNIIEE